MGRTSSNWFRVIRRKFVKSSASRDIIVVHSNTNTNTSSNSREETIATREEETAILLNDIARASITLIRSKILTKEDIAATKIQAHFRRHLARRAFRALRSLVRLQAMVRGARVRKQARIALHCMHALVRLQVSVRTRQLLGGGDGDDRSTSLRARLC